ncbi:MAG: ATP-grasp domain-containing protein [Woeseia sp.]
MTTAPRSVLVLHEALGADARPDELDTLVQVRQVSEALAQLHWKVSSQEMDLDLEAALERLQRAKPGYVFNLVESLNGRGELIGFVPALLESASIPFTGSGHDAINLSSQKILAKRWMRVHDIATPDWLTDTDAADDRRDGGGTWIVKSLWEHASLGLDDECVVKGRLAATRRMQRCVENFGGQWFAERYIDGREFNISVLEQNGQPYVLPIAEMTFVDYPSERPKIVGYSAKWDESAPEYNATQRSFAALDAEERDALTTVAKQCWTLFGLRGYARVDIRMDQGGTPWVLEVNANPCLARDAGFFAAATEAGFRYRQVIEMVLHAAIRPALPVLRRAG